MTFVPFFYRANVFTAYEYLERRFDARTRSLTSFLFLMSRGLAVSLVLYAPSIILAVIFGWSEIVTVLVMGASTMLYTDGRRQQGRDHDRREADDAHVRRHLRGHCALCSPVPVRTIPSADAVHLAGLHGKWNSIDLSLDLKNSYTLLSGMLGGFFLALSYFGCDQSQVQRYLTGRSLTESRLSLVFNAFLKVPMQFLILAIGVLMFVSYHFRQTAAELQRRLPGPAGAAMRDAEYAELEKRYDAVFQERREAALALRDARKGQRPWSGWMPPKGATFEVEAAFMEAAEGEPRLC